MKKLIAIVAMAGVVFALMPCGKARAADEARQINLILPSATLQRTGRVTVIFPLARGFTGQATLHIVWTDSLGRTVLDKTEITDLVDETSIPFHIDMTRAIAMKNHLSVDLALNGTGIQGGPIQKTETAEADFIAQPPAGWKDYVIMMWQHYPANLLSSLEQLGINGVQDSSRAKTPPEGFVDHNMRWYAESLATDYYSTYHMWRPDRPKDWSFIQDKKLYQENPNSLEAFKRHPSFWDPYWRKKIHERGVASGERFAPYRPFFYSLGDEEGIAELATQWDYGFSDQSIVPMRRWLKKKYGTLGALNKEWGTNFKSWNHVMPQTTNEAMKQTDGNFSSWGDFKAWMDISYADALEMGADAIREGDPSAYVGIGGGQMPGWGGYDYTRIVKAITEIEPYDLGHSVDLVHSLNPSIRIVTTRFRSGPWERHRVWWELLHGNSGLIIWDQGFGDEQLGKKPEGYRPHHLQQPYVEPDGQPSEVGKEAGKYYNEIRDGEGALIMNSHLINDRIGIEYSQPSWRTQWMLNHLSDGDAWMRHPPGYLLRHSKFTKRRVSWCELIEDEGLQYRFVGYDQIPNGILLKDGYHVLILPASSSMSLAEAKAIRQFVAQGGVVIADMLPGTYDQHTKRLPESSLANLFPGPNSHEVNVHNFGQGKAILVKADILSYTTQRNHGQESATHLLIEKLLRSVGVHPAFRVTDSSGNSVVGIDTHVFANGGVRIVSLQNNPPIGGDRLGPPHFNYTAQFESPKEVQLHLPAPMYIYEMRTGKALGRHGELALTVGTYDPTVLITSDAPLPEMQVSMPETAKRGSEVRIAVHASHSPADVSVFHVDVRDPQGNRNVFYSGDIIARNGGGDRLIPLAVNDATGTWTITIRDILNGQTVTRALEAE
ncbi:MAG: beta-galactosidase [Terriglobia bacterium]